MILKIQQAVISIHESAKIKTQKQRKKSFDKAVIRLLNGTWTFVFNGAGSTPGGVLAERLS